MYVTKTCFRNDYLIKIRKSTNAGEVENKIKLRSFKSSEHINEQGNGPLSHFSDPKDMAT